jgi:single-strand DNA-binding protein
MNNVTLQGNIASAIEVKEIGKHKVGRVLVAIDRPGKDKGADFIRVVMWNKTAENVAKYLDKGSKILVQGRIRGEFWEKAGKKQLALEVVAERVTFLDARSAVAKSGKAA